MERRKAKSDVKSEIIINDSHEDECLIYMRRSMASRKGMRVPCALGQFAPLTPHPPFVFELFIFVGQNSRRLSPIMYFLARISWKRTRVERTWEKIGFSKKDVSGR